MFNFNVRKASNGIGIADTADKERLVEALLSEGSFDELLTQLEVIYPELEDTEQSFIFELLFREDRNSPASRCVFKSDLLEDHKVKTRLIHSVPVTAPDIQVG